MGNEETAKNRKKTIRRLIIGFVVVMLLLTFFSATISNISLPKVSVSTPISASLQKVVNAVGTFAPKSGVPVNVDIDCKVAAIPVVAGDTVNPGDTLLTFDMVALAEQLNAEKDTLAKMKNNRKRTALSYNAQDYTQMKVAADEAKSRLGAAQAEYDTVKAQFDAGTADAKQLAVAQQALNNARNDYAIKSSQLSHARTQDSRQKQSNQLDLANMDLDIAAQQEKVDTLQALADSGGKVTAPIAGRVQQVNVQEGGMASPNQPVMALLDTTQGLEFTADISNDDAEIIPAQAKMDIHLSGTSKIILGTLREKRDSAAHPGQTMTLYLDTTAQDITAVNVQPNQAGDIRYTQNTGGYEMTLPNGAIREDGLGYFVLVAEEKSTPLGKQTVLRRVNVTVVDYDAFTSAISGPISPRDRVVTSSDKPVGDGDTARIQ